MYVVIVAGCSQDAIAPEDARARRSANGAGDANAVGDGAREGSAVLEAEGVPVPMSDRDAACGTAVGETAMSVSEVEANIITEGLPVRLLDEGATPAWVVEGEDATPEEARMPGAVPDAEVVWALLPLADAAGALGEMEVLGEAAGSCSLRSVLPAKSAMTRCVPDG